MSAFEHDLTIRLGEPFAATIVVTADGTPTGTPVNLAAATLTLTVYPLDGETDLVTKALSAVGQPGEAALALTTAEVADLASSVERTVRYHIRDGTGKSVARGWIYVAPAKGAV